MAQCFRFVCGSCGRDIVAWSDGNPYYIDGRGRKQYAYHPDHERLNRCIGNDVPHLCLVCGEEFKVDSRSSTDRCTKCGSPEIVGLCKLEGKACPYCREGVFGIDPDFYCIS